MDMKIAKISELRPSDLSIVRKVLTSNNITDAQKNRFLKVNSAQIQQLAENKISGFDFKTLMGNRPLKLFKPLKNSFTKAGDKKLLAQTLDLNPMMIDAYIQEATESITTVEGVGRYSIDEIEAIKTYVYRHGTKQQVINTLDYELTNAKDLLTLLYHTLEYNSGGVADYFIRPIHPLNNNTMYKIYNTIDKHLTKCEQDGIISAKRHKDTAEWALAKIFVIQNNQKLRNAVKLYRELN